MEIRTLGIADADPLADLSRRVFTATYGGAIRPDTLARYLAKAFNPKTLTVELTDQTAISLGAWQAEDLTGFCKLSPTPQPACITSASTIELAKLYVAVAYHGRGVAAQLMQHGFTEAAHFGFTTMWLYVWDRNPRAIAFYKKWNFTVVGEEDLYFEDVLFHDLVMERKLDQ